MKEKIWNMGALEAYNLFMSLMACFKVSAKEKSPILWLAYGRWIQERGKARFSLRGNDRNDSFCSIHPGCHRNHASCFVFPIMSSLGFLFNCLEVMKGTLISYSSWTTGSSRKGNHLHPYLYTSLFADQSVLILSQLMSSITSCIRAIINGIYGTNLSTGNKEFSQCILTFFVLANHCKTNDFKQSGLTRVLLG